MIPKKEGYFVEFKRFLKLFQGDISTKEIPATIRAFANTEGSVIYVSVFDNGEAVG